MRTSSFNVSSESRWCSLVVCVNQTNGGETRVMSFSNVSSLHSKALFVSLFCSLIRRNTRDSKSETNMMFSLPLSSSNVLSSVSSSLKSSHRRTTRDSPRGGITTPKAADVMREGNDVLRRQRRQRGREAREEEHATNARSRREVLKILPTSGVALVATTVAIGGFTAQPSFAAGEKLSSVEEKELAKERRKAAVRAAAERAKETGVGGNAFSDSEYMVGEDHSPNAHSHQEEGSKGSFV